MSAPDAMSVSPGDAPENRRFLAAMLVICAGYLLWQIAYIVRVPLVMDEMHYGTTVSWLSGQMPYRDFLPPKTVLGLYLQLPAVALADDTWSAFMLVKLEMALFNTAALAGCAMAMTRHFRRDGVLLSLALVVVMSTFAERSSDLRVDVLSAWFGLAGVLLCLSGKNLAAGVVCGLGLLVSQKVVYYVFAADLGLFVYWALGSRDRRGFFDLVRFNGAVIAVLVAYLALWSALTSLAEVYYGVFVAHSSIALQNIYDIHSRFWIQSASRNPGFYALVALALVYAGVRWRRQRIRQNAVLFVYGFAAVFLSLWHKQPWPYFIAMVVPSLWLCIAGLLDGVLGHERLARAGTRWLVIAGIVAIGMVPALLRPPRMLSRTSDLQRATIELAEAYLAPSDHYLAGTNMILGREQTPAEMSWLDQRRLGNYRNLSQKEQGDLVALLAKDPPRLLIHNYRLRGLPEPVGAWLSQNYAHLWGNLIAHAPIVEPGTGTIDLPFAGRYDVIAAPGGPAMVDGRSLAVGQEVTLAAGRHQVSSPGGLRLRYLPDKFPAGANLAYRPIGVLFDQVYTW